jgi:hypothetical protein
MPRADFLTGGLDTIPWASWSGRAARGELTRADIEGAGGFAQLRSEWFGFWSTHGTLIEAAAGIRQRDGTPGLFRNGVALNTSWQAGRALALIRARRLAGFSPAEWSDALASAMNASAAALGACTIMIEGDVITIVRGG